MHFPSGNSFDFVVRWISNFEHFAESVTEPAGTRDDWVLRPTSGTGRANGPGLDRVSRFWGAE